MATSLKNRIKKLEQVQTQVHVRDERTETEIRESIQALLKEFEQIVFSEDFEPVCERDISQTAWLDHQESVASVGSELYGKPEPLFIRAQELLRGAYNCDS